MPTSAYLETLPVEVLETVIPYLEYADICSLRLTAREIASKASQGSFRSRFSDKRLLLLDHHLQEFEWITRNSPLACRLKRLTVVEAVASADMSEQIVGRTESSCDSQSTGICTIDIANPSQLQKIHLLTSAFMSIKLGPSKGYLDSLTLSLEGQDRHGPISERSRFREWSPVGVAAATAFHCVSSALAAATLAVRKLDLFYDLAGCGLECDRLASILEMTDMTVPLHNLKILSLCLTHHSNAIEEKSPSSSSSSYGRHLVNAVANLINGCPLLHTLELRWYNLRITGSSRADDEEQHFFDQIANIVRLPSLLHFTLRGLYVTDQALMSFFLKHGNNLQSLSLEELHLHQGHFRPIFDYISENFNQLQCLHLNDLFEEHRLIQFEGSGVAHFPHPGGPSHINLRGPDSQKPIGYSRLRGRIKGSSKVLQWWKKRSAMYGPP